MSEKNLIKIESDAIVVTIGHMGVGKTTFINTHFERDKIVSLDETIFSLFGHHEFQIEYTKEIHQILFTNIEVRASIGLLTVVDSLGTQGILEKVRSIANKYNRPIYALIFNHLSEPYLTEERLQEKYYQMSLINRHIDIINKIHLPDSYKHFIIENNNRDDFSFEIIQKINYELNPNYEWIIVPDIHGHYDILRNTMKEITPDKRIVFLGDIGDRGPSTYLSFLYLKKLIESTNGVWIKGNHDEKLNNYFKSWINDKDRIYDIREIAMKDFPSYSVKIYNTDIGFKRTLQEFYSLSETAMEKYAEEYLHLYNENSDVRVYSSLKRDDEIHYFAHANITNNAIRGNILTENDKNSIIGRKLKIEHESKIRGLLNNSKYKKVYIHLGHDVIENCKRTEYSMDFNNKNIKIIKHDQGIGKAEDCNFTPFMVV